MLFFSHLRSRCKCPVLWCLLMGWSLAIASPLIQPPHSVMVCSSAGIQWVVIGDGDDGAGPAPHTPDCALCLPAALPTPPPDGRARLPDLGPLRVSVAHSRFVSLPEATPPPARGPPRFPSPTQEVFT